MKNRGLLMFKKVARMFLNKLSDEIFLRIFYFYHTKKRLRLKTPRFFNEKLQWLKLYDRKPEYTVYADKYAVREHISNTIGDEHLVPLLGVWKNVEEINFDLLSNSFVLKCNHGSAMNLICKNKKDFDIEVAKAKLKNWLNKNHFYYGREWPYKHIKPLIIAEEYLEDEIIDYKFYCFNGTPKFLYLARGGADSKSLKMIFLDLNWNKTEFQRDDYPIFMDYPEKPINFDDSLEKVRKLASGIPFVRIDFFAFDDFYTFSELTFTPGAAMMPLKPYSFDIEWGKHFVLPQSTDNFSSGNFV